MTPEELKKHLDEDKDDRLVAEDLFGVIQYLYENFDSINNSRIEQALKNIMIVAQRHVID